MLQYGMLRYWSEMLDAVPMPAASALMPMLRYAIGTTLKKYFHLMSQSLKLGKM
jgi:hypothetical protein